MSISIFDIAKGIYWPKAGQVFLEVKNSSDTSWILIDYLNNNPHYLIQDQIILNDFHKIISTGDKQKIEAYIMKNLYGFSKYDEGIFAFIAGANDKSPSILYDYEKDSFSMIHPNLQSEGMYYIALSDLLFLINQKLVLTDIILKLRP